MPLNEAPDYFGTEDKEQLRRDHQRALANARTEDERAGVNNLWDWLWDGLVLFCGVALMILVWVGHGTVGATCRSSSY